MSSTDRTPDDVKRQLFSQLDDVRAGMLGVDGARQHMQPMTHNVDAENQEIWFITSRKTDLVEEIGTGSTAQYCVIGEDHDYYACLRGPIEQVEDEAKLDELWNAVVAAWFDDGREDSDVTLLRMTLNDGAIWTATDSAVVFGLQIAMANMDREKKPDLGEHHLIQFNRA